MVVATASAEVAPADRRFYALRNVTAPVESLPLIVSSILSKKLAVGTSRLVFDVKTGNGAFFADQERAVTLASLLVRTAESLGTGAVAIVMDMSQPLGRWAGSSCEIREVLECLQGDGDDRLLEVVLTICEELLRSAGRPLSHEDLESVLSSGAPRERFLEWASAQGAAAAWLLRPSFELPLHEVVAVVQTAGVLSRVDTRRLGMVLLQGGAGRLHADDAVDGDVSLCYSSRPGDSVEPGQELARLYLRRPDADLEASFHDCFEVAADGSQPLLIRQRISA